MLKIKELMKMLEVMGQFFVSQLLKIVFLIGKTHKCLIINKIKHYSPVVQFSVSGSGFSVLAPAPDKFNSLYRASGSLKMKK